MFVHLHEMIPLHWMQFDSIFNDIIIFIIKLHPNLFICLFIYSPNNSDNNGKPKETLETISNTIVSIIIYWS